MFFIMKIVGITVGSFIGGNFLDSIRLENVYIIAAVFPMIVIFQAIFLFQEQRAILHYSRFTEAKFTENVNSVHTVLTHPDIFAPLLLLVVYSFLPNIHHGIQWFVIDVLRFTPTKIGISHLISGIVYIVSMYIVYLNAKKFSLYSIFFFAMILNLLSLPLNLTITMTYFHLPKPFQILVYASSHFFRKFTTELMMIPTFSRICAICPVNHESMIYSFMAALISVSESGSRFFGALI